MLIITIITMIIRGILITDNTILLNKNSVRCGRGRLGRVGVQEAGDLGRNCTPGLR